MSAELNPKWLLWAILVAVALGVLLWAGTQRRAQQHVQDVRQQVEQQMYQEGELGHRPGEAPVRTAGK